MLGLGLVPQLKLMLQLALGPMLGRQHQLERLPKLQPIIEYLPEPRLEPAVQLVAIILSGPQLMDQQLELIDRLVELQQELEFLVIEPKQLDHRQPAQLLLEHLHQQS